MAARAAAVDLAKISNLGLGKNTLAQISAFRKRADDAKRQLNQLKQQNTEVDFAHYNKVLRNKDVVSQAQKILSEFKPVTYDVQAQLKAIDAFESKAVGIIFNAILSTIRQISRSPSRHVYRQFRIASHRITACRQPHLYLVYCRISTLCLPCIQGDLLTVTCNSARDY